MSALPEPHRLPEKPFEKTFHKGRNIFGDFLGIKYQKKRPDKPSRFGFVVGLKVSKKATERNQLKRRLKAITFEQLPVVSDGFDVIVLAKPKALSKDYQELQRELKTLLKKANMLVS